MTWPSALLILAAPLVSPASIRTPPPPKPETVQVIELPLPPVSADDTPGACTIDINPNGTGCIAKIGGGSSPETTGIMAPGEFLPDSKHVISMVVFVGAPTAPHPASIYSGEQIILIKTDGGTFPNGDSWKCITCGIPPENRVGMSTALDYPQSFGDGKRILAGNNVISCGKFDLISPKCTPEETLIHVIRWNTDAPGTEEDTVGGAMRELRIHPDNEHLGFSSFIITPTSLNQKAYMGRLHFNANPASGLPRAARYDLSNVTLLDNVDGIKPISVKGDNILVNDEAITIGELRGFSGRGGEVVYLGSPRESGNTDVFAANIKTGKIRRLTTHPEYVDPIDVSPDDEWMVILDTRATDRHMFLAGMRGVPPLVDMVAALITTGVRNNGPRRFFQPYLLDRHGDRDGYYGQKINGPGNGVPGSDTIDDPEWNALADPRWSPDGTAIVYWQAKAIAPACGGPNPLPCFPSTAEGGRTYRLMLAKLTSRKPLNLPTPKPISDFVPWGTPYVPGSPSPVDEQVPVGEYTLRGKVSGFADVTLAGKADSNRVDTVITVYHNYSDDGSKFLNGWENVTAVSVTPFTHLIHWYAELTQTGENNYLATKKSSPGGFHIQLDATTNFIEANGTLTTTINGVEYTSPKSGT